MEIGVGIVMDYNLPGDQVFSDIFTTLIQVRDWLRAGDCEELSTTGLAEVTKCTDDLLRWRSEIGAKVNRLEMTRERMTGVRLNVQKPSPQGPGSSSLPFSIFSGRGQVNVAAGRGVAG